MEYLHGGTVREAVKIHKLSPKHVAFITREMLKGIDYIHTRGWAHRDLKSSNVMLSIEGQIKLGMDNTKRTNIDEKKQIHQSFDQQRTVPMMG